MDSSNDQNQFVDSGAISDIELRTYEDLVECRKLDQIFVDQYNSLMSDSPKKISIPKRHSILAGNVVVTGPERAILYSPIPLNKKVSDEFDVKRNTSVTDETVYEAENNNNHCSKINWSDDQNQFEDSGGIPSVLDKSFTGEWNASEKKMPTTLPPKCHSILAGNFVVTDSEKTVLYPTSIENENYNHCFKMDSSNDQISSSKERSCWACHLCNIS